VGWHDPIGGLSDAALVKAKYGVARYQEQRNQMYRNGRDSLLIELGKYGLGKKDLVANINFFSKVTVDESGEMRFQSGNSTAGDSVELRFEMNTLVVLSTSPHALDSNPVYAPKAVQLTAWHSDPPGDDDFCRNFRPENRRGFYNTEILFR
jgi:urea carboxylase-associated protein 2